MKATATEVKNRFGEFLDKAQKEPVMVMKSGRDVAVLLSREEYDHLQRLEDHYWGERALEAEKNARRIGHEETMRILNARLKEIEGAEAAEA